MITYAVDYKDEEVQRLFESLKRDMPEINRRILGVLSQETMQRSITGYIVPKFRHPTGKLAQSINFKVEGNDYAEVGTNLVYAAYHEYGFHGRVQVSQHTRNGALVRAHGRNVNYPGRPYLRPALDDIFTTGRAEAIIEGQLKQELDRRTQA